VELVTSSDDLENEHSGVKLDTANKVCIKQTMNHDVLLLNWSLMLNCDCHHRNVLVRSNKSSCTLNSLTNRGFAHNEL